ncbi:DMT family transporter [Actinomadura keratinilytica]|uniref:DMT family transporter n=1 Tax=Actinomadura keratinilytica TaxID=547461 RepID=A0ABP7YGC1_9ACTN
MSRRGWVLFALLSVLWGIPYLLIKVAVAGVSVPVLVFARTALGALVMLPLAARAGGFDRVRRHWRPVAAFAALEIIGPWALLSDAERHLSSSMTGLLIAAVPIVGAVLDRATGDTERLGPLRWTGLLLGLGGVAVLAWPQLDGGAAVRPVAEVLLVVIGYATAPMIVARRLGDVASLPLNASCLTLAALVYAPAAVATRPAALPDGRVLAALAGLGAVCTALAFLVFFELIREVGASRAMVVTYVNPAVAVIAGVLVLGEPLTLTIAAAFALILCGSLMATARRAHDAPPAKTAGPSARPAAEEPAPRA